MSLGGFVSCGAKFLRHFQLNICCNLRMVFHMKMYFLAALEVIACNRRTSEKMVLLRLCLRQRVLSLGGGGRIERCQGLSKQFKCKTTCFTGHTKPGKWYCEVLHFACFILNKILMYTQIYRTLGSFHFL